MEREGTVRPDKPLNVRCAEALGCIVRRCPSEAHHPRYPAPFACGCEAGLHGDLPDRHLLPYGEETPAGWACTGPLIGRFGLRIGHEPDETSWFALSETLIGPDAVGPCAAIAEWVAEFGAEALRKEPRT